MDEKIQIAFAEVIQVLKYFDREYVMKIPIEILQYFKEHQKKGFVINIDKDDIFNKNNISRDGLALLACLDLKYWCTEEEKDNMKKIYIENEIKYQEELSKKSEYNNIFKKEKNFIRGEKDDIKEKSLIEYKKENIFTKIKNKILIFLRIK